MPNCRAPIVEAALSEPNAVPLIVLSAARDPVEAVNSTLRRAGHPVHCTWIPALRDLGDALAQINPELLLQVAGTPAELGPVIGAISWRRRFPCCCSPRAWTRRSSRAPSSAARAMPSRSPTSRA
jgi:hypothetical protein